MKRFIAERRNDPREFAIVSKTRAIDHFGAPTPTVVYSSINQTEALKTRYNASAELRYLPRHVNEPRCFSRNLCIFLKSLNLQERVCINSRRRIFASKNRNFHFCVSSINVLYFNIALNLLTRF